MNCTGEDTETAQQQFFCRQSNMKKLLNIPAPEVIAHVRSNRGWQTQTYCTAVTKGNSTDQDSGISKDISGERVTIKG